MRKSFALPTGRVPTFSWAFAELGTDKKNKCTRYFKNLKNRVKKFHLFQKKWFSRRIEVLQFFLMEETFSLRTPDPAGELLSGGDENATFLIFFTPFLRFLKYRVHAFSLLRNKGDSSCETREAVSGSELNAQKSEK